MSELAADAGFFDKHVDVVLDAAELGLDPLDRNCARKAGRTARLRAKHRCHAAFAGDFEQLILAVDQLAELRVRTHWTPSIP